MPRYNIWIKKQDNDKWLQIANKSDWIHNQLNKVGG